MRLRAYRRPSGLAPIKWTVIELLRACHQWQAILAPFRQTAVKAARIEAVFAQGGDCLVGIDAMALRATTAVAGAAFLPFRPPQFSLCRRTAATIGTGQSLSSGVTMKEATAMRRFTTEEMKDRI